MDAEPKPDAAELARRLKLAEGQLARYAQDFRKTIDELRASEGRLRGLVAAAQDAVIMLDDAGSIVQWNAAAERMFGYTEDEAVGHDAHELLAPASYRDEAGRGMEAFARTGTGPVIGTIREVPCLRKDGTQFPGELSVASVRLGQRWYAVGILRDISRRKQAESIIARQTRARQAISECNMALVRSTSDADLLQSTCEIVSKVCGYACVWIALDSEAGLAVPRPRAWAGAAPALVESMTAGWSDEQLVDFPPHAVLTSGQAEAFPDLAADRRFDPWRAILQDSSLAAMLSLPLTDRGVTLGAMVMARARTGEFDDEEVVLLRELADDIAYGLVSLEAREAQRRLEHEQLAAAGHLNDAFVDAIAALGQAVAMRDPYTGSHQTRVAELAVAIATELGWDPARILGLRLGALVHDVGKIQVPAEILNRPGPLSAVEEKILRQHPGTGHEILKRVGFPWPVQDMVLQHHERLDGSGYPEGLRDDEILPEARILAVADAAEAMQSHRPHRPAFTLDATLAELEAQRGVKYEAAVVDACIRLFREEGFRF